MLALLDKKEASPEANQMALSRIYANPAIYPVAQLIDINVAALVEPCMQSLEQVRFNAESRVAVRRLIEWHLDDDSWGKSRTTMCNELDIPPQKVRNIENSWPDLYVVVNVLVRQKLLASRHKVDASALKAAVEGDSRDRRLYYELTGEIRKEAAPGGPGGITFVNNVLVRPASGGGPVAIDVEAKIEK